MFNVYRTNQQYFDKLSLLEKSYKSLFEIHLKL